MVSYVLTFIGGAAVGIVGLILLLRRAAQRYYDEQNQGRA